MRGLHLLKELKRAGQVVDADDVRHDIECLVLVRELRLLVQIMHVVRGQLEHSTSGVRRGMQPSK